MREAEIAVLWTRSCLARVSRVGQWGVIGRPPPCSDTSEEFRLGEKERKREEEKDTHTHTENQLERDREQERETEEGEGECD